ncbi:MAG TPA: UDP-N-acetylmuramoyl-L-alanine--D-glutamate ligase, partial [Bacilli bacterium]|nr:UDP-N-acetylmuramoyl-L-alanine--D-glutamate ligase [Bacilli bacterium]
PASNTTGCRGNSFDDFIPALEKVKAIITFGETKQKLVEAAEKAGVKQIHVVKNVEEAVPVAFSLSEVGDVILLSPACASWDQYKSFEIRGDKFIEAIENLN